MRINLRVIFAALEKVVIPAPAFARVNSGENPSDMQPQENAAPENKKSPRLSTWGCRISSSIRFRSATPLLEGHNNQDILRAGLLASGSASGRAFPFSRTVTSSGLCPRLQRRDRGGNGPAFLAP